MFYSWIVAGFRDVNATGMSEVEAGVQAGLIRIGLMALGHDVTHPTPPARSEMRSTSHLRSDLKVAKARVRSTRFMPPSSLAYLILASCRASSILRKWRRGF